MSPAVIRHHAVPLLAVAALAVAAACADDTAGDAAPSEGDSGRATSGGELIGPAPEGIDGVQAYRVDTNSHTEDDLAYQLVPPVGGDHFPVPATCGFYETDVPPDEMIVHDLEHGAVWIAFAPDLDDGQQVPDRRDDRLRQEVVRPHRADAVGGVRELEGAGDDPHTARDEARDEAEPVLHTVKSRR